MIERSRQESTRIATTDTLMKLMDSDSRVVLVISDSLLVIKGQALQEKYPDRVIEVGISEQCGVDVSVGLATAGMIPFFATYAGFITMRACEQVRTFVAYSDLNVKLIGANGGIAAGEREGPTHQFIEDIGILRTIPGMTIVVPADASQVREAIKAVAEMQGPAFIRIGSGRDPVVFDDPPPFELGKYRTIESFGSDVVLFGCGTVLTRVRESARQLQKQGIGATVVEVHTIKPLDAEAIAEVAGNAGAVVTIEDHNIIGGLGSAVAEALGERMPVPMERVGIRDVFARSGNPDELLDQFHIGISDIVGAAERVVTRKGM
jgi:transketolase